MGQLFSPVLTSMSQMWARIVTAAARYVHRSNTDRWAHLVSASLRSVLSETARSLRIGIFLRYPHSLLSQTNDLILRDAHLVASDRISSFGTEPRSFQEDGRFGHLE